MRTTILAWLAGVALGVASAWTSPAWAADEVLSVVPSDALGFVVVNRLGETDAKVQQLSQQMQVPMPGPLALLKAKAELADGLDEEGSAAVLLMPGAEADANPIGIVVMPVGDYQALLDQYETEEVTDAITSLEIAGKPVVVAAKGSFALFARPDDQQTLETVLASETSIVDQMSPWKTWLDENDAAAVLTQRGLKTFFVRMDKAMEQAKEAMASLGDQGTQVITTFEMYQRIFKVAKKELTTIGVALRIEDDGALRLSGAGRWTPGGQLAQWFVDLETSEGGPLAGLPNGEMVAAAGGATPRKLLEAFTRLSVDMMKANANIYGLDDQQAEKMVEINLEMTQNVRGMSAMLAQVEPDLPLYAGAVVIYATADSSEFIATMREQLRAMAELTADAELSPLKDMKIEDVEIDGAKGLKIKMNMPWSEILETTSKSKAGGPMPAEILEMQTKVIEKIYGDGLIVGYLVAADSKNIVCAYHSEKNARKAVAALNDADATLTADAAVAKTLAALPADAQWVALLSPSGIVSVADAVLNAVTPADRTTITLPPFPPSDPVGLSVSVSAEGGQKQLYIPADVLKNLAIYAIQLRMAFAGQQ